MVALGLGAVPLLMLLNRADVVSTDEAESLAVSLETWQHFGRGEGRVTPGAAAEPGGAHTTGMSGWQQLLNRLTPRFAGEPRLDTPPGVTWTHLLAFGAIGLDTDRPPPDAVIAAGRFSSALLGLVTIAAVFWAGHSLGGNRTGRSAALAMIACPYFLWHARLATGAVHLAVWPALSFAAALWAIRPLRPAPSFLRQLVGWGVCGVAMGLGCLTAGSVALWILPVPVLLALVLSPRRISHALGLLAAVAIAGLLVVPWALVAHTHEPNLYELWLGRIDPARQWTQPDLWSAATVTRWLPAAILPWTLWLVGAAVQPFSPSPGNHRRKTLICWFWLAVGCAVPWLTACDRMPDAVFTVLPAGALLVGYLFAQYSEAAAEARRIFSWSVLQWPFVLILGIVSLLLPFGQTIQGALVHYELLDGTVVDGWSRPVLLAQSAVLLVILGFGARWVLKDYPTRALACWALWAATLFCFAIWPVSGSLKNPAKTDALTVRTLTTSSPLYWYTPPGLNQRDPDPALGVYCGSPIIPLSGRTRGEGHPDSRFFLLTPQVGPGPIYQNLRPAVPTLVGHLPRLGMNVWRVDPPPDRDDAR